MTTINRDIISAFKDFDWYKIISNAKGVADLNDRQWRFLKGLVIELSLEKYSGSKGLKYVGDTHKDFDFDRFKISVEAKTQVSDSMFTKKGNLRSSFTVKLNNSLGTNRRKKLDPEQVADILLVVRNDGAFIVSKDVVLQKNDNGHARSDGDGFVIKLYPQDLVPVTDKIDVGDVPGLDLQRIFLHAIRQRI